MHRAPLRLVVPLLLGLVQGGHGASAESLQILPGDFNLSGPHASQQLVLEAFADRTAIGQTSPEPVFVTDQTNIVQIVGTTVRPIANGSATIRLAGRAKGPQVLATVRDVDHPPDPSFRNQIQPILAKAGCSSGACHGAAAGQNGFHLSLRGYDDTGDHLALTRNALGRRIFPPDAAQSLLLLKPTAAIPHKGGRRFEVDSPEYRLLADWIAAGTPGPAASDPHIDHIEILPAQARLQPGAPQQLLVRAWFSDHTSRDVTRWTKFTAANAQTATVSDEGLAKAVSPGQGAVTAWFLSKLAVARITVPATNPIPHDAFARLKNRNFIDREVLDQLRALNIPPSDRCDDGEFIRRAYLDTLGVLPTAVETRDFLSDNSRNKRDRLIEALFTREEFVDYWTYKWSDLLLVQSRKLSPTAMWAFHHWIRERVSANTPWDRFVAEVLTSQGSTLQNGAANFFVLHEDPRLMAETTSQAFLGMSINCARCHNHPLEKWTNDEYYSFANLFARVRSKAGSSDGDQIVFATDRGDVLQPLTGKPQPPRPLDAAPMPLDDPQDRRVQLAAWVTSPDNPYFAKAIVNRIWKNFFAVGLVEPVDDLRVSNPPSNEALLLAATRFLVEHKFNLVALMREILRSETYQRASAPQPENLDDSRYYSHRYARRLMAEVLLDALSQVTGSPTRFKNFPEGWRALQLPDANVDSYFLRTFGRPERTATCECERSAEPTVTQMLHISNGDTLNGKLADPHGRIATAVAQNTPTRELVEDLYLAALARLPSAEESQAIGARIEAAPPVEHKQAIEDLYWAVLSSKEFLFNH